MKISRKYEILIYVNFSECKKYYTRVVRGGGSGGFHCTVVLQLNVCGARHPKRF